MTSRERVTAWLRHEIPDRMGIYEHFWGETLRDSWAQEGYPKDTDPAEFFDYDMQYGVWGSFDTTPFLGEPEVLEESDAWQVTRDGYGATLKYWKTKDGTPQHLGFTVTTPAEWQPYREALLATDPSRLKIEETRAGLARVREQGRFALVNGSLFVGQLQGLLGDLVYLPALLQEPDWIHEINRTFIDFYQRHFALLFAEAGPPDGMFVYDDLAFRNGPFFSPQVCREMFLPYMREMVGFFHDHGVPVILHTCGDVRKLVPMVLEAGFDCLQPMEAKAGCNVVEFAETYGSQIAYMGNMDVTVLNTNDRTRVREEIVGKLEALKRLRVPYFFHSDHSIPPDIRLATYQYALELFREHGTY
jgi:uroporphyrinogen decarboxylase